MSIPTYRLTEYRYWVTADEMRRIATLSGKGNALTEQKIVSLLNSECSMLKYLSILSWIIFM